tara:strand:- start:139 stop:384 length:246 start_codon:yes stop_codon:yes gene_type:complete
MEQMAICVECDTEAELIEIKIEDWSGTEKGVKRAVYYIEVTECCESSYDIVDKPMSEEEAYDNYQDYLMLVAKEERNGIYD